MTAHEQGRLIMFDGPDGVGKTTQINRVADQLRSENYDVYTTRSHGGTPMGELLREASFKEIERQPLTDHYISMAIHAELRADINSRRALGQIVLVDRSPLSNWAYQVYGSGLKEDYAKADIERSMGLFKPDLLICYAASVKVLRAHIEQRGNKPSEDYFESKLDSFYEDVIAGYKDASKHFGAQIIDAEGTIDEIFAATWNIVRTALPTATR